MEPLNLQPEMQFVFLNEFIRYSASELMEARIGCKEIPFDELENTWTGIEGPTQLSRLRVDFPPEIH